MTTILSFFVGVVIGIGIGLIFFQKKKPANELNTIYITPDKK